MTPARTGIIGSARRSLVRVRQGRRFVDRVFTGWRRSPFATWIETARAMQQSSKAADAVRPARRRSTGSFTLVVTGCLSAVLIAGCSSGQDWRTASREPAGIAPDPRRTNEAVLQVYGADAWSWRGWFAIHTWIAAKRTGEDSYRVYDVVGWRGHRGRPVMRITRDYPDRYWFGERPVILKEHRGPGVDALIDAVDRAASAYPWKTTYRVFPGPNSNTFTGWIARQVPELALDLPLSAIGSGYRSAN